MRRPVLLFVAILVIALVFSAASAWGQRPQFPANETPSAEAVAAETASPFSLPGSAPPRRSLYADQAATTEPSSHPVTGAEAAPPEVAAMPADAPSFDPPAATEASIVAPSPVTTNVENTSAGKGGSDKAADQETDTQKPESVEEKRISLKLPAFVPKPIRDAWDKVVSIWRYELFMKVTPEQLLIALVLLFIGYLAAKRISSWFAARVLGRLGIPQNSVATIRTISFYALMAAFTLSTLGALGVPVTIFSYFGGALAVGIGFGSQNIVNNFISGLILLAERPIRVGDVIQVDGLTGKVTEIGARSTRITTGSNMEILVPNSTILQGNVVNWTLSDDLISSKVTVGVGYGSPARQVAQLLLQAAEQNSGLLKEPAPGVSFTNFGDHGLEFELSFWLRLGESSCGKIESDLRFAIDDLFAQHGIIIAYPQRDVHLNLLRPVEVRLTPPAGELRRAAA